jgi:hypothetical protein
MLSIWPETSTGLANVSKRRADNSHGEQHTYFQRATSIFKMVLRLSASLNAQTQTQSKTYEARGGLTSRAWPNDPSTRMRCSGAGAPWRPLDSSKSAPGRLRGTCQRPKRPTKMRRTRAGLPVRSRGRPAEKKRADWVNRTIEPKDIGVCDAHTKWYLSHVSDPGVSPINAMYDRERVLVSLDAGRSGTGEAGQKDSSAGCTSCAVVNLEMHVRVPPQNFFLFPGSGRMLAIGVGPLIQSRPTDLGLVFVF